MIVFRGDHQNGSRTLILFRIVDRDGELLADADSLGSQPHPRKTHVKGSRTEPCPIAGGDQEETNRRAFSSASPSTILQNSESRGVHAPS